MVNKISSGFAAQLRTYLSPRNLITTLAIGVIGGLVYLLKEKAASSSMKSVEIKEKSIGQPSAPSIKHQTEMPKPIIPAPAPEIKAPKPSTEQRKVKDFNNMSWNRQNPQYLLAKEKAYEYMFRKLYLKA